MIAWPLRLESKGYTTNENPDGEQPDNWDCGWWFSNQSYFFLANFLISKTLRMGEHILRVGLKHWTLRSRCFIIFFLVFQVHFPHVQEGKPAEQVAGRYSTHVQIRSTGFVHQSYEWGCSCRTSSQRFFCWVSYRPGNMLCFRLGDFKKCKVYLSNVPIENKNRDEHPKPTFTCFGDCSGRLDDRYR